MDEFIHYGVAASFMAIRDAGLEINDANADRIGALIGSGIGGLLGIEQQTIKLHEGGPRKVSPFYVPSTIINSVARPGLADDRRQGAQFLRRIRLRDLEPFDRRGDAADPRYGDADVMIAGGAERGSTPSAMGGFCAMKAMSTRNDDPERASRPWDAGRDGFVLGDGAGILVLEEYEYAKARGARIYCGSSIGFGDERRCLPHHRAAAKTAPAPRARDV